MRRQLGQKAAAAIMTGLLVVSTPATTALANAIPPSGPIIPTGTQPTVGEQTGTGQTDLTMVLKNGSDSYGGTEDPNNPDDNNDGLGDNLAFTVPSAINYVVRADGRLLGPSQGAAHIDNESAFSIEVDNIGFEPSGNFQIVPDAKASTRRNAVDLQLGPEADMLQMSDCLNTVQNVNDPSQWRMTAKGNSDTSKVQLTSAGDVANLDADMTSRQRFGKVHWRVSPASTWTQGLNVSYELNDTRTGQTVTGQKTLLKIHTNTPYLLDDILPGMTNGYPPQLTVEVDGKTYQGTSWDSLQRTVTPETGEPFTETLDHTTLDGKSVTIRGNFRSVTPPQTYEQGVTVNYELTDTRTQVVTTGQKTLYELGNQLVILSVSGDIEMDPLQPLNISYVEFNNEFYSGYDWQNLKKDTQSSSEPAPIEFLDLTALEGQTITVYVSYASVKHTYNYNHGVTANYEVTDITTEDVTRGQKTITSIDPEVPIVTSMLPDVAEFQNWPLGTPKPTLPASRVEVDGKTYEGSTWNTLRNINDSEELLNPADLDGKTINVTTAFATLPQPISYAHGITVNYELTNIDTMSVTRGQKTINSIQPYKSPADNLITSSDRYLYYVPTVEVDGKTYAGDSWKTMSRTVTAGDGSQTQEYINLESLDGKTITVKAKFKSKPGLSL